MKRKYLLLTMILFVFLFLFSTPSLALIPGDFGSAGGGPPDGCVDFEDLMIFAMAYGSTPADTNWNLLCDIYPDGVIDFEDLMVFAMHYGESECIPPSPPTLSDPGDTLTSPATYTVSWSLVSGATSYVLQEATSSGFSGAQEYTLGDTSKDFSHTVSTNTTYYYRVAARNDCGQGGWSNVEDIIINCCAPPSAPILSDPGTTLQSSATYTVSWTPVTGAKSYVLQEATSSGFSGAQEYTLGDTSKDFSHTVSTNTTYYYRVAAVDSCGQSGWSNIEDLTVASGPVHNLTKDTYYNTIQAALDDADTDNIIEVADGTYNESITFPTGKVVTLQSASGIRDNVIIQGANNFATVTTNVSSTGTTLRGFTITHTGGNTGRGIYIGSGNLIVDNCIISGNTAYYFGGGICNYGGTLTVTGSIISGNTALTDHGGGIFNYDGTLTVTGSTISGNTALTDHGGGICNYNGTSTITGSTISGNSAYYYGGGINNYFGGTLTVTSSTISGNTAASGGGINNVYGGTLNISGTLNITLSIISDNTAYYSGGGISNGGTLDITSSTISGNNVSQQGGGIYLEATRTSTIGGSDASDTSNFNVFTDNKKDGAVSADQHIRDSVGDCRGSYPYNTYNPN